MDVLWECVVAMDVWRDNSSSLGKWSNQVPNMQLFWTKLIEKLTRNELQMVAFIFKHIWPEGMHSSSTKVSLVLNDFSNRQISKCKIIVNLSS